MSCPSKYFLTDNTISENIAFGIDKALIDHKRVEESAMQAQISDFINNSIDGYDTIVGEEVLSFQVGNVKE